MGFYILGQRIHNIFKHRRMLGDMSILQLKSKYAGLKLGLGWVIIIPLMMALCINFVFVSAFKVEIPHYAFFILCAIFPWFFISQGISEAANIFIANKGILRQGVFPQELVLISSVISNFINFIFGFLIIIPFFFLINKSLVYLFPFLVVLILLNLIFVLGLSFIFAVLNTFFRDVAYFLPVGLMFWFWITPVFYSERMFSQVYRWVCLINPATYYISAYRKILYFSEWLTIKDLAVLCAISFITLVSGYFFYLKNEPEILKKI
ncbi:MAG TPA: ABC transporter permease [Candidatus Omnitrophota bacterium]|nr:ABC transporter permease [Candidatus Omnitrophota bacterium]